MINLVKLEKYSNSEPDSIRFDSILESWADSIRDSIRIKRADSQDLFSPIFKFTTLKLTTNVNTCLY